jgi:hypothetical protein
MIVRVQAGGSSLRFLPLPGLPHRDEINNTYSPIEVTRHPAHILFGWQISAVRVEVLLHRGVQGGNIAAHRRPPSATRADESSGMNREAP